MRPLLLSLIALLSVVSQAQTDTVFHDMPVTFSKDSQPFSDGYSIGLMQRQELDENYERDFLGYPKGWTKEETFISHQILDFAQHLHQKHLAGESTDSTFNLMSEKFNVDYSHVIDEEVACMRYMAFRGQNSCIQFVVDANANLDFSDDEVHELCWEPRPIDENVQKERVTLDFEYEYVVGDDVKRDELSMVVMVDSIKFSPTHGMLGLLTSTYGYGEFTFEQDTFYVRSLIAGYKLSKYASLYHSPNLNSSDRISKGDYFNFNGRVLQFTGISNDPASIQFRELVNGEKPLSAKPGFFLPSFGGTDVISGNEIHTNDFLGKYVYIDVWGSWCTGCVIDLPHLVDNYANRDSANVAYLGVAYDVPENLDGAIEKYGITWPNVLSSDENNITELLNVKGYPTTILINPEGKVIATGLRGENLNELIAEAIEEDQQAVN